MPKSAARKVMPPMETPPGTPSRGSAASPCTGSSKKRTVQRRTAHRAAAAAAKRDGTSRALTFSGDADAPFPGTGEEWCERMTRIKEEVYERCTLKRQVQPGRREKCAKAFLETSLDQFVREGQITAADNFLDIGSAVGNVVFSMASRTGCRATGVEFIKHNHNVAVEAKSHFEKYWAETGMGQREVHFVHSDIRQWLPGREQDYSVVWIANMLMPVEVDAFMINRLRYFKPGTRIFTMKDLCPHNRLHRESQAEDAKWFTYKDLTWPEGGVEWFPGSGEYFMYTRTDYMGEDEQ